MELICLKILNSLQEGGTLLFTTKYQEWSIFIVPNLQPPNIYLLKVNYGNIRAISEICSKLTKKTTELRRSSVLIVNFEQILQLLWRFHCSSKWTSIVWN